MVVGSSVFDLAGELAKAKVDIQNALVQASQLKETQTQQRNRLNDITPKVVNKRVTPARAGVSIPKVDYKPLAKELVSTWTPMMLGTTAIAEGQVVAQWFEPNGLGLVVSALVKYGISVGVADMIAEMAMGENSITTVYDAIQWCLRKAQEMGYLGSANGVSSDVIVQSPTGVKNMAYGSNSNFRDREPSLLDAGLDPKIHQIGSTYEGWEIKEVGKVKGRSVQKEHKWYRPVYSMTLTEKMAYSQGLRSGKVEATKFWKRLYLKWKRRARMNYRQAHGQTPQYVNMN
jgi:hypothetical protein